MAHEDHVYETVEVEVVLKYKLSLEDCSKNEVEPTTKENIWTLIRSPDCALLGVPGSSTVGRPQVIITVK